MTVSNRSKKSNEFIAAPVCHAALPGAALSGGKAQSSTACVNHADNTVRDLNYRRDEQEGLPRPLGENIIHHLQGVIS